MKKLTLGIAALAVMTLGTGCEEFLQSLGLFGEPLEVASATLNGDVGPVLNVASTAPRVSAQTWDDGTRLDLTADAQQGSAMMIVDVDGGLFHPGLAPGNTYVFDRNDRGSDLYVSAIGCAGESDGSWDYDHPAEEVEVEVEEVPEDPGVLMYTVTATFPEYNGSLFGGSQPRTVATSTFVVGRPGYTPELIDDQPVLVDVEPTTTTSVTDI